MGLRLVADGKVLRGPDAVRQFLAATFMEVRAVHLDINEISRWRVGDVVFAAGIATCEFEWRDGTHLTFKGCWTDARREFEGRWVYVLKHATELREGARLTTD